MNNDTAVDRRPPSGLARLYWRTYYLVLRAAMGAAFFVGAAASAMRVGVWLTLPMAACAAAMVCGFVAMRLSQAAGRVSYINRLAVIVLPIGLHVGRGRLLPMFAWSTALWSAVGMAGAIYGGMRFHATHHAPLLRVLLIASLFVDGASFVMLTKQAVTRLTLKSPGAKPVAIMLTGLLALMVGGVGLWMADLPWPAVLLAGGPPLIAALFYGFLFLALIINPPR